MGLGLPAIQAETQSRDSCGDMCGYVYPSGTQAVDVLFHAGSAETVIGLNPT